MCYVHNQWYDISCANPYFQFLSPIVCFTRILGQSYLLHDSVVLCDMIFIYCNRFSTRWQWSVNLYKNKKRDSNIQKEKQYTKQYKNTEYTQ